jgi:hypothetical protein
MCSLVNRIRPYPAIQRNPNDRSHSALRKSSRGDQDDNQQLKDVPPVCSSWLGKQVVLLVTIRQCHVPMPCSIIGESLADVRVRVQPGWEMDIRKELILAVEEGAVAVKTLVNLRCHPASSNATN